MNTLLYVKKPPLAKPWVYFLATYVWSWSFFGIAYLLGVSGETGDLIGLILMLLALSGPTVTALILVYSALNTEGKKDYWRRIIDYKKIHIKWYFIIFFLMPTISILAAMLSGYWNTYSFANKLPSLFLILLSVPLVPIIEELGWRGYVLDRLQEKYNPLISSIILGALWGVWHLPVFFLPNSSLSHITFFSLAFWLYFIHPVVLSICFTWIYNHTDRSTLSAVLFHIMLEFSANTGIIPWDKPEVFYNVALWTVIAMVISSKRKLN